LSPRGSANTIYETTFQRGGINVSLSEESGFQARDEFEIRTSSDRDGYVIQPRGELDLATTDQLHVALVRALHSLAGRIVLDLSRLVFIDAAGIRTIISASRTAHELRKELLVAPGPRQVRRTFQVAGVAGCVKFAGR
jgi:anti-sigma B factor antagonist